MIEIYNMGISEATLKNMLEINPEIAELTSQDIIEKEEILKGINCSKLQVLNIISSNPLFLSKTNGDIIKLLNFLTDIGFTSLNILIDSNPYVLNLDPFEIKNYIDNRVSKGKTIDEIIDDLDSNPYLFQEI